MHILCVRWYAGGLPEYFVDFPVVGIQFMAAIFAELHLGAFTSVFLRFFEGCRGGALGCQYGFPFYVWHFYLIFIKMQVSIHLIIWTRHSLLTKKKTIL